LVLAAADVTLRRDVAFDLALPFLGAALLGFRDFAMERVGMELGSVGSRIGIDVRTTQSPARRGASPKRVGGRAGQPADAHSNASFAAEVQTNSEAAARLRRLG
jgi:hypothetical protein